jgi:hypothetical protein
MLRRPERSFRDWGKDHSQMPWKTDAEDYQAHDRKVIEQNSVELGYENYQGLRNSLKQELEAKYQVKDSKLLEMEVVAGQAGGR